ncbi:MAG: hypothetical protein IKR25_07965 [Muribaculaceae bacterium]|nr:hypothetical protein [Muribaculaceae bacterium]
MKKLLLLTLVAATALCTQAQKLLQATEVPNPLVTAYMNQPGEYRARIDVKCVQSIPLSFETQCDKYENMRLSTESDGVNTIYTMLFDADPTVREYSTRMLTITAPGYDAVYYDLSELKSGQWLTINVNDPNATVDTGCYNEHHNKGMNEIKNMNYSEALRQFTIASTCAEVNQAENEANIALADSLRMFRLYADNAYNQLDYRLASTYYEKVLALNSYDSYARDRNAQCIGSFTNECEKLWRQAEWYYDEHDYTRAKELYQQLIDRKCNYDVQATEKLQSMKSKDRSRKNHDHVITYEWQKDAPIGIHTGKYNMHKAGGFFQLSLNPKLVDAIRDECKYEDPNTVPNISYPEFTIQFGWTLKIKNPVWIHFGPGFTGKMYYGKYEEENYPYHEKHAVTDATKNEVDGAEKNANFAMAITPIVGITVKYSYFAIRCSYQYRFALRKPLQEFIEPHRVSVGVGVAF